MKLPSVSPMVENAICRGREEFAEMLSKAVIRGGAFAKVFGKVGERAYYMTLLVDREKILAAEAIEVGSNASIVGTPAIEKLKGMLDTGPVIVDVYPMNDVEVKASIMDNITVYSQTPKVRVKDSYPTFVAKTGETPWEETIQKPTTVEELYKNVTKEAEETLRKKGKPPKRKLELRLDVPLELDPYFRGLVKKLNAYGKSIGLQFQKVNVTAREIRYALGSGVGINTRITIEAHSESVLPATKLENMLRERAYKEAGELSSELKKRVVISDLKLRLV